MDIRLQATVGKERLILIVMFGQVGAKTWLLRPASELVMVPISPKCNLGITERLRKEHAVWNGTNWKTGHGLFCWFLSF